jgi:hypothetical protein
MAFRSSDRYGYHEERDRREYFPPSDYADDRDERTARGSFVGRGPKNFRRSDDRIREDVCDRLTMHGEVDPSDVEVRVEDRVVTLLGTVDSRFERRLAAETAASVLGVVDVHDQLKVIDRRERAALAQRRAAEEGAKEKVVTALFRSREAAQAAVERLVESGLDRADISILMSQETGGREFGFTEATKAPEGAAAGAAVGGVLGAIAAGLAAVGTIALPGIGLLAAGPIIAALAGAGAGGAAGTLIGALVGAGMPEHEAKFYSDALEAGGILVAVQASGERAGIVEQLLRTSGGESVTTR